MAALRRSGSRAPAGRSWARATACWSSGSRSITRRRRAPWGAVGWSSRATAAPIRSGAWAGRWMRCGGRGAPPIGRPAAGRGLGCAAPGRSSPLMIAYHDHEWGVPVHDDVRLFEMLTLEGAQAGLSWETILRKRAGYRRAFAGFDPERVARFDGQAHRAPGGRRGDRPPPRQDRGGGQQRARAVGAAQHDGSFERYVWSFVDGTPIDNHWRYERARSRLDAAGGAAERRPTPARLPLRGPDDGLRVHAGGGLGERPPGQLRVCTGTTTTDAVCRTRLRPAFSRWVRPGRSGSVTERDDYADRIRS